MKMLGYVEPMRYVYRLENKRLSEGLFWLVTDANFMNVVKWLSPTSVVDMYCLPKPTEELELPWDENGPTWDVGIDMEIGEILESISIIDEDMEVEKKTSFAFEAFDDMIEGNIFVWLMNLKGNICMDMMV